MAKQHNPTLPPAPHTGNMLQAYMTAKRTRQNALARALNRNAAAIIGYKQKNSIQTETLWELSNILKYNFFADIAAQLPPEFPAAAPAPELVEAQAEIENLKTQIAALQIERDTLYKMVEMKMKA